MTTLEELNPKNATVEVEHEGVTYKIKKINPKRPPVKLMRELENNRPVGACEYLLGAKQFNEFLESDPDLVDMEALVGKALGTEVGKSGS